MVLDLQDLRCVVALGRTRSFTRAAEAVGTAQPPFSRRIQALEARLGVVLVRRGARPVELTDAGRFLLEQAETLLSRAEALPAAVRRVGEGGRRFFGVGFVGSTLYGPLPRAIRRFREAHPGVEVGLAEMSTHQQREAIRTGRIDVGFGRLDLGEDAVVGRRVLLWEPLVCACARDHPFAGRAEVSLREVAAEPFLLYPGQPRPSFADQVLAIFAAIGAAPAVVLEANEVQTAIGLAVAGVGVTLVPAPVQRLRGDELAHVRVSDEVARSPVIVSFRAQDGSALLRRFLALVDECGREM